MDAVPFSYYFIYLSRICAEIWRLNSLAIHWEAALCYVSSLTNEQNRTEQNRTPVLQSAGSNSSGILGRPLNPPSSMLLCISRSHTHTHTHTHIFHLYQWSKGYDRRVRKWLIVMLTWYAVINFNLYNVNKNFTPTPKGTTAVETEPSR